MTKSYDYRQLRNFLGLAFFLAIELVAPSIVHAQFATTVVVVSDQLVPNGDGRFRSFDAPAINDAGQVAFIGRLTGTDLGTDSDVAVFRGDRNGNILQLAREAQIAPPGDERFRGLGDPYLNNAGQVAFYSRLNVFDGLFLTGDNDFQTQIARPGFESPNGLGEFTLLSDIALNDAGRVAFHYGFSTNQNPFGRGVIVVDGAGGFESIAFNDDLAPSGNGTLGNFRDLQLNNAGQVVFSASLGGTVGGVTDNIGLYRGGGTARLTEIARRGETVPVGIGEFSNFSPADVNESGQVAFVAELMNTIGSLDRRGIFLSDGVNETLQIARSGRPVPAGQGTFSGFDTIAVNNSGQVAFSSGIANGLGGTGIFIGDGLGTMTKVVLAGDVTPDGMSTFTNISTPTFNDLGQVAFRTDLRDMGFGGIRAAIFFYDENESGLVEVIRVGDSFLGSTVSNFTLLTANRLNPGWGERSGLNELGQIAFGFALIDGRSGIAIATPALRGDFDNDGSVGLTDLDFYSGNIGVAVSANPSLAELDLNSDGTIDGDDLAVHYSQFVQTSNGRRGTFAGDANLDGTVDVLNDAFALVGNLGNSVSTWSRGDFNGDRTVDVLGDAFLLVANLGQTNASP